MIDSKKRFVAHLAAAMGLLTLQSHANAELNVQKGDAAGAVRITVTNPSDSACGVELKLGDGRSDRRRLEAKEQWQVQHTYGGDGSFNVGLSGAAIMRGLRSVGPCSVEGQVSVNVAGGQAAISAQPAPNTAQASTQATATPAASPAAPSPGANADLVLFHRKSSNQVRFVTAVDGSKRLDSAQRLLSGGYSLCYVLFPEAYRGLGAAEAGGILNGEVNRVMSEFAGNRPVTSKTTDCVVDGRFVGGGYTDVVAVQRRVVASLASVQEFAEFERFAEIKYDALAQIATRRQQASAQRTQDAAAWTAEIASLGAADSTDKVGSIAIGTLENEREAIKACTLEYAGPRGQAVVGYAGRLVSYMSPAFRSRAAELRATFNADDPFTKVYRTIDDLYADLQRDPKACHIVVDFPKNLNTLMAAIRRDRRGAFIEVNNLVSTLEAREAWAKKQGYEDVAASDFAAQIRGNPNSLKSLAERGIKDKAAFDRAAEEMVGSKYSDTVSVGNVLEYLSDKAAAAEKRGATAISVRDERLRIQRAEAERRAQEEQRRRAEYAKEFPYTATISCGLNNRHINIRACMSGSGSLKSQLEIANGSDYKMYQSWEVGQAGRETGDGLVIALRPNFRMNIQNVHDSLILSLKIVSTASGQVVYNQSAARFGVVAARN